MLLWLVLVMMIRGTAAQAPQKQTGIAYQVWAFDGSSYRRVFSPEQMPELYLLAGHPVALSAHRTLLYHWPLTDRYLADWSGLNRVLSGTLELLQGGHLVARVELTSISLVQFGTGTATPIISLVTGAEAGRHYEAYRAALDAYARQMSEYDQARQVYEEQMAEAIKRVGNGERDIPIPSPPVEPASPNLYATVPISAFVFTPAEGHYTLQLRDPGGRVVAGSGRTVFAFGPQRRGLTYTVIPEKKWTQPEQSLMPDDTLYLAEGGVLYLQPRVAQEYNEAFYRKLKDPQDAQGREDRSVWVPQELVRDGIMEVMSEDRTFRNVTERPYLVRQMGGMALGYTITEYHLDQASEEQPTFRAYRLELSAQGGTLYLRMRDGTGQVIAGSGREVRVLHCKRRGWLYLPALVPVAVSLVLHRRRRAGRE
ncbi:MAG: hypothetical protein ACUVWZ_07735 [Anaerolineae bacterium]